MCVQYISTIIYLSFLYAVQVYDPKWCKNNHPCLNWPKYLSWEQPANTLSLSLCSICLALSNNITFSIYLKHLFSKSRDGAKTGLNEMSVLSFKTLRLVVCYRFIFISIYRLQLTVCIGKILQHDFPEHWPTAPQIIHNYLASDNRTSWFGALVALYQIVKKYEFKKAEQRIILHDTMKQFLPLMYQRCASLMQDQSQPATEIKKMIIKTIFAMFQV